MANYKLTGKPGVVVPSNGQGANFQVDLATWEAEGSKRGNVIYTMTGSPAPNPLQTRVLRVASISGPGPFVVGDLVADLSLSYPGNTFDPQGAKKRASDELGIPIGGADYFTGNLLWVPVTPTGYGTAAGPDPQKGDTVPNLPPLAGAQPWVAGPYKPGDAVSYGGMTYLCVVAPMPQGSPPAYLPPPQDVVAWRAQGIVVTTTPLPQTNHSGIGIDPSLFLLLAQSDQKAAERREEREAREEALERQEAMRQDALDRQDREERAQRRREDRADKARLDLERERLRAMMPQPTQPVYVKTPKKKQRKNRPIIIER